MAETVFYNSRNLVGIGNVGIGTTNPTTTLHVKGNAIVDGNSSGYYTSIIPKSSGTINNVNITALNARTRTSNASATAAVSKWTSRASASDLIGWTSVCWAPELSLFVAVANNGGGSGNRVMTSPDGINWTAQAAATDSMQWQSVCWAPELSIFVAVAGGTTGNRVMTSSDGINWTAQAAATDLISWRSVCWAPELSLFVAVAGEAGVAGNRVMTSPNGTSWTARVAASDLMSWRSVCWAPELSLFVAVAATTVGTGNRVMTSPDGITWTARGPASDPTSWNSVCWAPELSLFVAVASGGSGNRVMMSPDGINWTSRASANDTLVWNSVCWAPELSLFAAVANSGSAGNRVMTSAIGMPNSNNVVKALTSQMVVLPSGNVGIGTTSPGQLLTVWGSGTTPPFHVQSATSPGSGYYGYARFTNPSGGYGGFLINHDTSYGSPAIGNASDPPFQVKVAGYNALTVMAYNNAVNSGGVGIGTASPGYPLVVNYTNSSGGLNETGIYINNTLKTNSAQLTLASGNVFSIIAQGSLGSPSNGFSIYNYSRSLAPFNISSAGNVGIGTASPSSLLHLGATLNNKIIALYDPTGTAAASATDFYGFGINAGILRYQTDSTSGAHVFYTGASERMRISGSGYVGIGTVTAHALLTFDSTSANKVICISGVAGTNPATATDFNGFGVNGTLNLRYQSVSSAGGGHVWYMGATEAMRLGVNAGNLCLGIGTASPTVQLELSTDGARKLTTTTWTTGSDQRIKTDIQSANLLTCYDTVKSIDLKYFKWNFPVESNVSVDDKHSLGFIAQDVRAVFPNAVFESNSHGFTDFLSLNTDQILKAMYGALRQTMADKEDLETKLQTAQNDIDLLESRLAAIEALIGTNTSADTEAASTGTRAEALLSQV